MMKQCDKEQIMANLYQFLVISAIIGLNIMTFIKSGEFNDTLVGALIGVCVGIPVPGTFKNPE